MKQLDQTQMTQYDLDKLINQLNMETGRSIAIPQGEEADKIAIELMFMVWLVGQANNYVQEQLTATAKNITNSNPRYKRHFLGREHFLKLLARSTQKVGLSDLAELHDLIDAYLGIEIIITKRNQITAGYISNFVQHNFHISYSTQADKLQELMKGMK